MPESSRSKPKGMAETKHDTSFDKAGDARGIVGWLLSIVDKSIAHVAANRWAYGVVGIIAAAAASALISRTVSLNPAFPILGFALVFIGMVALRLFPDDTNTWSVRFAKHVLVIAVLIAIVILIGLAVFASIVLVVRSNPFEQAQTLNKTEKLSAVIVRVPTVVFDAANASEMIDGVLDLNFFNEGERPISINLVDVMVSVHSDLKPWDMNDCLDGLTARFYNSKDDAFVVKEREVVQRHFQFEFGKFNYDLEKTQGMRKQAMKTPSYVVLMCARVIFATPSAPQIQRVIPVSANNRIIENSLKSIKLREH